MPNANTGEFILKGISGSPGICIGKAYLVDREGVDIVKKYEIDRANIPDETNRFKTAVNNAIKEIKHIIDGTPEELQDHVRILEAHMALFKDKMLYGKTISTIETELVNAEWALKKVITRIKAVFQEISDPYLQARSADITHVSERIMRNLVGGKEVKIADIDKRVILIAKDLSPAETSQIQLERIKGFVTDRGGKASHTSIIARTLEIPCVLGLDNATKTINNDDIIIVDGSAGLIVLNPEDDTLLEYEAKKRRYERLKAEISRNSHLPAETTDGIKIKVHGNIELPEEIVSVRDHGGDGIGLFRTEFQYLSRNNFPSENELFEQYKDVVEVMAPHPVTIRTLDINGDKALSYTNTPDEINPALGLRAIRFCLKKPDVFRSQLRAILRSAAYGNVKILFPMISSYEEIVAAKRLLNEAAESLDKDKLPYNLDIEIGIMIEVPSAVIMAEAMAKEVDFFSIGTNDLIQYSLAIDRGNEEVAHMYSPLHPAVIHMVKHIVDVGKRKNVEVCMCGEMAGDPLNMPILLGLGLNELSMNPQSIPSVKNAIRNLDAEDSVKFVKGVLKQSTTQQIADMVNDTYSHIFSAKNMIAT